MNVNESAAASTKVVGAAAIISRALYRVLTLLLPAIVLVSKHPTNCILWPGEILSTFAEKRKHI
jgi:hypothetical protein